MKINISKKNAIMVIGVVFFSGSYLHKKFGYFAGLPARIDSAQWQVVIVILIVFLSPLQKLFKTLSEDELIMIRLALVAIMYAVLIAFFNKSTYINMPVLPE